MEQKIIQVGNSTGVIIPKVLLEQAGFETGTQVIIETDPQTKSLVIRKKGKKQVRSSLTPEFMDLLKKVNEQYGDALKELAQK
ncbi:MAG TPA: AbrB/MazE/SpoVT family DNA-binding domain-containing protein [Patescibacteria group bacterium]|nr:AbrB/MazE/SpoVT family DNA-binding domain-containing protein [Patescibacteria group bacterium]